jgi:UDP-N-acetylmuramoyl-L-alanyl-D-glutamate--2,6-diaminopimelate ligase
MPSLIELIHAAPETLDYPLKAATLPITGITADSRQVRAGNLFVALKGLHADGTAFIEQARQAGAAAILCDRQAEVALADIPLLRADNPSRALAFMAARFYKSQPEHMVAVTGTDGKTSVCDFFRQFWHGMGQPSASIGTLGILSGGGDLLFPSGYTTPTPVQLHKMLADLQGRGIGYAGLEASSQGLDQYRMDGVHLEAAAFTNIARDHMDYHHTDDAYFAAKARLFSEVLPTGKTAILNQDDAKFPELAAICERRKHAVLGFGRRGDHLRVAHIHPLPHGQQVDAELFGKPHRLDVPLVGAFQVMNILAALGLAMRRWMLFRNCAAYPAVSNRWRNCPAVLRCSSITPIRRWRWLTSSTPCARTRKASCASYSAAAATAMRASARKWAASPPCWPMTSSSPTIIRAAKTPP